MKRVKCRILELMTTGEGQCSSSYVLEGIGSDDYRKINGVAACCPPLNKPIIAYVEGTTLVDWEKLPPVSELVDTTTKNIMLVLHLQRDITEDDWQEARSKAAEVQAALRARFRDYWDTTVTGYAFQHHQSSNIYSSHWRFARDHFAEQGYDTAQHNYFVVWGGSWQNICGHATVGGFRCHVYRSGHGCRNTGVFCHELGHNFGWGHSSQGNEEYGDSSCVQGASRRQNGWNACRYWASGMLDDYYVAQPEKSSIVYLAPVEYGEHELRDGEKTSIIIPTRLNPALVSTRGSAGFFGPAFSDLLYVHDDADKAWTNLVRQQGAPYEPIDIHGVSIRVLDVHQGIFKLGIDWHDGLTPVDPGKPTDPWLPPVPGRNIEDSSSGLWYDPDFNGQGLHAQFRGGQATVYWYTYHPTERGRHRWYLCQGDIKDGIAHLTIYQHAHEDPTNGVKVGRAWMYLTGAEAGIFKWELDELRRGHYRLTRLASEELTEISGSWYDPQYNGEGFSFAQVGNSVYGYWYGYGTTGRLGIGTAPNPLRNRWTEMHGTIQGDEVRFELFEPTDGLFWHPRDPELRHCGEATWDLNSGEIELLRTQYKLKRLLG